MCCHVGSPVLGGNPLYRVSKWRTFEGKSAAADPFLSREATLCSKQEAWTTGGSTLLERKGLQGFIFFHAVAIDFFLFSIFWYHHCVRCWTSPIFTSLHQKQVKLHEASLHENNNEVIHFTKTSSHLFS